MRNSAQRQHPHQHQHQHQNAPSAQHDDDSSASGSHSSHSHSDGGDDDDDDDDDDDASIDSLDKSLAVPAATHNHSSHGTANIDRPFPFPFPDPDPFQQLPPPQYDRPASNAYTRAQNHERRMSIGDLSGSDALEDSASDDSEASADSMDGDGDGDSNDDHGSPPQSPYEHHHHPHHHHHQKPLPHKPDRAPAHPPSASASRHRPPVQPAAAHVRKRTIGGGSAVRAPKPGGAEGTEGGGVSRLRQPSAVSTRSAAHPPPRTRAHRNDAPRHGYAGGVAGAANIEEVMEDVMGGSGSGGPRASQSRSVGWTLDVPEVWGTRTPTSAGTHYQPKLAKTPTDDEINKLWAALRNGISSNRDVQEEEEEEEEPLPHADALQAQPRPAGSITGEPSSRSASAVQHQPPGTASSSGGGSEPGSRLGTAAGRFNLQNTLARARAMTGSSRGTRKQTKAERIRAEAEADEAKLLASLEKLNTRLHITYTDGKPPTDGAAAGADSNDAAAAPTKSPSKSKTGAGSSKGKQKAEKVIDGKVWDGKGGKALSAKEEQIIAARKAYSTKKPKKKPKERDAVDAWMLRSVNDTLSAMAAMEAANR